jgi:hypothetical protein
MNDHEQDLSRRGAEIAEVGLSALLPLRTLRLGVTDPNWDYFVSFRASLRVIPAVWELCLRTNLPAKVGLHPGGIGAAAKGVGLAGLVQLQELAIYRHRVGWARGARFHEVWIGLDGRCGARLLGFTKSAIKSSQEHGVPWEVRLA